MSSYSVTHVGLNDGGIVMTSERTNIVLYCQDQVKQYEDRPAYRSKRKGEWVSRSWREYGDTVKNFALGLLALGMKHGDVVAILGSTREEWDIADRASLAIGCVGVGIYPSNSPEQVRHVIDHCEAKIVVVENKEQWDKIEQIRSRIPGVEQFILMDPFPELSDAKIMSFAEFLDLGRRQEDDQVEEYWGRGRSIQSSDAAIYVYTSGTTGPPKGAVLTHGNIMAVLSAFRQMRFFVPEQDRTIAWLPLAHVFGRFALLFAIHNAQIWSYVEDIDSLIEDLAAIQPTFLPSVPRIYEKIYQRMISAAEKASPIRRSVFHHCMKTGRQVVRMKQLNRSLTFSMRARYVLAKWLLFRKVRNLCGGELRLAVTGGAPLSTEIIEFFHAAGILILEGYGLAECPVAAFNRPGMYRCGTVGPLVPGTEVRIADDGEILVRSPITFAGYLKDPDKTNAAFTGQRWYCTGDVGVISPDGFLTITDRKKDIIITAGGKNVGPQNIENALKSSALISQAMVYGDRKPYLTALITLDPDEFNSWAEAQGKAGVSLPQMCQDPALLSHVEGIIKEKSEHLAKFETIKKFTILPHDFSEQAGEITPTLKVKRRFVAENYRELIDQMYG